VGASRSAGLGGPALRGPDARRSATNAGIRCRDDADPAGRGVQKQPVLSVLAKEYVGMSFLRVVTLSSITGLCLAVIAAAAEPKRASFQAGAATSNITPPLGSKI